MQLNTPHSSPASLAESQAAIKAALVASLSPFCRAYLGTALWCTSDENYNKMRAAKDAGYTMHSEPIPAALLERGQLFGTLRYTWVAPGESNGEDLPHDWEYEFQAWCAAFEDMGGGSADGALDRHFSISDFSHSALVRAAKDCARFEMENAETLANAIATGEVVCGPDFNEWERAGHDFWLSRNGHGAGFFDGDWPEPYGDTLQDAAEKFGGLNPFANEAGEVEFDNA